MKTLYKTWFMAVALTVIALTAFIAGCGGAGGGGGGGGPTATLISISVTPANPSIPLGATKQFEASGTYSDGTNHDITTQVAWRSSNTSVATVNSSALATAVATGTTTITAASGSISGNTTLTVTPGTAPSTPQNLKAIPRHQETVLFWEAPSSIGSSAITKYEVYRDSVSIGEVSASTLNYLDTHLVNGRSYSYTVKATNSAGDSRSSTVTTSIPLAVPSIPREFSIEAGENSASFSWDKPSSEGVSSTTKYYIYHSGSLVAEIDGNLNAYSLSNYCGSSYCCNTTYCATISAKNIQGEGSQSQEVCSVPVGECAGAGVVCGVPVPRSATSLNAIAVDSNAQAGGSAVLSWKQITPADCLLDYYTFEIYKNNVFQKKVSHNYLDYTDTGLTVGTNYCYRVDVVGGGGTGVGSDVCITPTSILSNPTNLIATTGSSRVILNWIPPVNNGGFSIVNYKIYRGTSSGTETYYDQVAGNILTYTDSAISVGTTYYYKVSAANSSTESHYSNEVNI